MTKAPRAYIERFIWGMAVACPGNEAKVTASGKIFAMPRPLLVQRAPYARVIEIEHTRAVKQAYQVVRKTS